MVCMPRRAFLAGEHRESWFGRPSDSAGTGANPMQPMASDTIGDDHFRRAARRAALPPDIVIELPGGLRPRDPVHILPDSTAFPVIL